MLAVIVTFAVLMLAQPGQGAACAHGVYRAGCVGPNGAVGECASHIRTVTVIGTTLRLVAPTVRTERGVSDPMVPRSSAGHISGGNQGQRVSKGCG